MKENKNIYSTHLFHKNPIFNTTHKVLKKNLLKKKFFKTVKQETEAKPSVHFYYFTSTNKE
jgi:hypothetical protein